VNRVSAGSPFGAAESGDAGEPNAGAMTPERRRGMAFLRFGVKLY
jgi:hypothetical protein